MNSTSTNYFRNLFMRKKKLLLLYTLVIFVAFPFTLFVNLNEGVGAIVRVCYALCQVVLGILAVVLPIFTFKFTLVKKNVDTYYSLPINRDHLFKAHFFAPIVGAITPIFINFVLGSLLLMIRMDFRTVVSLYGLLLLSFIIFIVIYSVNSFFVLRCNSVLDAAIITAAVTLASLFIGAALTTFLESQVVRNNMIDVYAVPQLVMKLLSPFYGFILVQPENDYKLAVDFASFDWTFYIYYVVIGIAAIYFAAVSFKNKKGEDAEQLSTDFLTYPLFINLILICLILIFNLVRVDLTNCIFIVIALFVLFFIANGVAHRSMKLTYGMVIRFAVLIAVINGFNYISKETEFFGINRQVVNYRNYKSIEVYVYEIYENTGFNKKFTISKLTDEEKKALESISELQAAASQQFKNNEYGYSDDYNISIIYEISADDDTSVHYNLNKKEAAHFLDLLEQCDGITPLSDNESEDDTE